MNAPHKISILLVEDNTGDAMLTKESLLSDNSLGVDLEVTVATDGEQAINIINGNSEEKPKTPINLVLLDLGLPRPSGGGFEVLAVIRRNGSMPVIILTTSDMDDDIRRAMSLHANAYLVKPLNTDTFARLIKTWRNFWVNDRTAYTR